MKYDISTLMTVTVSGVQNGIVTQNEARDMLHKPRKEDPEADKLRQQMQMVGADESSSSTSQSSDEDSK